MLRSIQWKLDLQLLPNEPAQFALNTRNDRECYREIKKRFDFDPKQLDQDLETNNPLSLSDSSPWQLKFKDMELKKEIQQDVKRTFPDIPLFQDPKVQIVLENVLFTWSKMNPNISYRQGMHELAAVVFLVVQHDAASPTPECTELCDEKEVEMDTLILFFGLMNQVKRWYEMGKEMPVLHSCTRIFQNLMEKDYELYRHLHLMRVEPQLFGLRWLRLLFSREFPIQDVLQLWDHIFREGFELVEWIAVAMLHHIRQDCSGT
jgi:hypothetical protein